MLTLRPYQVDAVDKAVERGNLLMAMTMGSGKTATAIAAVRRLRRQREVSHGVVFALKSTLWQWVREIHRWDPRASVQVIEGTIREKERGIRNSDQYHWSITNYETLNHCWDTIKESLAIDFVILDEATMIKGFRPMRSRRAKVLGRHAPVRMALSGQPVESKPEELFSIMEFVDADVLGPFGKFDRVFIERDHWGKPKRYRNLPLIHQRLGDAMFRRSREDIAEWLPEMIEIEMPVQLSDDHMALHDHVRDDLSRAIDAALSAGFGGRFDVTTHYGRAPSNGDSMSLMGEVMSCLLAMRMLSSHPALLKISADEFDSELSRKGSRYASELRASGILDNVPDSHDKFDALVEHVTEILDEDPRHKVVIFSYFRPMVRMIRSALKHPAVLIDGAVSGRARDVAIQKFNNDPNCRVFLSTDAGAYGVDLNQGSHLVCYDLPWSAGALAQRISRIDRTNSAFGQINIGYMFGLGTIEERMLSMLQQKRKVARAFLDGEYDARSGGISLDLQSLREFLDS